MPEQEQKKSFKKKIFPYFFQFALIILLIPNIIFFITLAIYPIGPFPEIFLKQHVNEFLGIESSIIQDRIHFQESLQSLAQDIAQIQENVTNQNNDLFNMQNTIKQDIPMLAQDFLKIPLETFQTLNDHLTEIAKKHTNLIDTLQTIQLDIKSLNSQYNKQLILTAQALRYIELMELQIQHGKNFDSLIVPLNIALKNLNIPSPPILLKSPTVTIKSLAHLKESFPKTKEKFLKIYYVPKDTDTFVNKVILFLKKETLYSSKESPEDREIQTLLQAEKFLNENAYLNAYKMLLTLSEAHQKMLNHEQWIEQFSHSVLLQQALLDLTYKLLDLSSSEALANPS